LQYTIESRPLTNVSTHRGSFDGHAGQTTIEASDADDALSKFVHQNASELVSLTKPLRGMESIATVRKEDHVFLVRVYAA
jgi:hypothetical protein